MGLGTITPTARTYLQVGSTLLAAVLAAAPARSQAAPADLSMEVNDPAPGEFSSPLEVDGNLAGWLAEAVDLELGPRLRFDRLLAALRDPHSPGFVEQVSPTLPASTAFRDRRINCVSFAFLVVALARSLDLPAYFVLVPETLARQRSGGLAIEEQHLAAAVAFGGLERVIDFAGDLEKTRFVTTAVPDLTAIALFHSNRGIEALADEDLERAAAELHRATVLDPTLAVVWANLGVVERRRGDLQAAEQAYRTALALDPQTRAARTNFTNLLASRGEAGRAARILAATANVGPDPFSLLELAESSLRRGDLAAARAHYQRALELSRR